MRLFSAFGCIAYASVRVRTCMEINANINMTNSHLQVYCWYRLRLLEILEDREDHLKCLVDLLSDLCASEYYLSCSASLVAQVTRNARVYDIPETNMRRTILGLIIL